MYRKLLNTREESRLGGMAVQDTTPVRRPGNAAKMMNHTGNIPPASKVRKSSSYNLRIENMYEITALRHEKSESNFNCAI